MAKWLEYVFVYMLLFLFAGNSLLLGVFLGLAVFILINLIDNSSARVNIGHSVKIILGIGLVLSVINIFGIYNV